MGLFNFLIKNKNSSKKFKIKNIEFIDDSKSISVPKTNLEYKGIEIIIGLNREESLKNIEQDYKILTNYGIEKLIKENFISWLKGEEFKNLDDEKIYNGLKLYYITYNHHNIIAKYSPTNKDDSFGEFEFHFESENKYTEDLLQTSAYVVLVCDGKIYQGRNYDV